MVLLKKGILSILILLLLISVNIFSDINEKYKKIEKINSKIEVKENEYLLFPEIDERELRKADLRDEIISKNEIIQLCKYIKKNMTFGPAVRITNYMKFDPLKKYGLYYVVDLNPGTHAKWFWFAVRKGGKRIHRFREGEFEFAKKKFKVRVSDIKFFNKILKEEKVLITDPAIALDVCMLFLKLARYKEKTVISDPKTVELLIAKYDKEMEQNNLKEITSFPLYKKQNNNFYLKFYTNIESLENYDSLDGLMIEKWEFIVATKGKIDILDRKTIYAKNF